jgi:acetyltransferase-like isoleucine patch superfamily enzyme
VKIARERVQISKNPVGYARRIGVTLSDDCWLAGAQRGMFGTEPYLITIGRHVAIASGVRFITHDGGAYVFREEFPDLDLVERITIGDNVVVGMGCILLPGTEIGSDSVIGAGSVVTGTLPPRTVSGGVPAKPICSIDDYRQRILKRAIFVAHLPHDERRPYFERFLAGEIDGHCKPLASSSTPPS